MPETSVRKFKINPSQYELFRFTVSRPSTLHIRLIASAPVNLLLVDSDDRREYENGTNLTNSYTASWGRRSDLDATVDVEDGTWYLIVEGSTEKSSGRLEVYQE